MPAIDRLANQKTSDDFEVITISLDRGTSAKAEKFFKEINVEKLDLYTDSKNSLSRAMGVTGLPVTVILDRNGAEIARAIGPAEWDAPEVMDFVDILVQ